MEGPKHPTKLVSAVLLGIKRQELEAELSLPSIADVKNGAIPSFTHTYSWCGASINIETNLYLSDII
jgi:hypothetical protein